MGAPKPIAQTARYDFFLVDIALWRAQLRTDSLYIGMQLACSDEGSEAAEQFLPRYMQAKLRIEALEANQATDQLRDELDSVDALVRHRERHPHRECSECKIWWEESCFRQKHASGHVAQTHRCLECEFPRCAVCELVL